jgi:arginase family enzyme
MNKANWLPHSEGTLSSAKGLVLYWFSTRPEDKISFVESVAETVFYPFGSIEPLFEIKENLSVESLMQLSKRIQNNQRLYFFTDTHEKTFYIYDKISRHRKLKLIILDAHPDCFKISKNEGINFQNFVRELVDQDIAKPENIVLLGLRNPALEEIRWLDSTGISYYTILDIVEHGDRVLQELEDSLRGSRLHLSLDLDALSCKACNWVEPFGIPEQFLLKLVNRFREKISIFDITELDWNAPDHEKTYYLKLGLYLILLLQAVKPWRRL